MSVEKNVIRLAMVDDHDLLRNGVCQFLESYGFETIFDAENGQVALQKLETASVLPQICIVDVNMPVMDGFETVRHIRERYPGIKILAFSVNDDRKDVLKMLENGTDGYILKGADPDELKNAINIIYNGGKYFSTGILTIVEEYFQEQGAVKNPEILKKKLVDSTFTFSIRLSNLLDLLEVYTIEDMVTIPLRDFEKFRGFKKMCKMELVSFIEFEGIEELFNDFDKWKQSSV